MSRVRLPLGSDQRPATRRPRPGALREVWARRVRVLPVSECTALCGRPAGDASYLCGPCTADLRTTLAAIPDLLAELDVTLTRQAVHNHRGGPQSADKPLPYDPRASEAGWVLRNTLHTWCRVLDETVAVTSTAEAAMWLHARVGQLRTHPAAGEAHDEIRTATTQATRVIDQPAHRARIPIGPCPEPDCTGQIIAYIPTHPDRPAHMNCGNGHTWEPIHWRSVARRITTQATA